MFTCPCCGDDLYARPPMSYLEREGFVLSAGAAPIPAIPKAPDQTLPHFRIPSLRFTLIAMGVSVASACSLAFGLLVFLG